MHAHSTRLWGVLVACCTLIGCGRDARRPVVTRTDSPVPGVSQETLYRVIDLGTPPGAEWANAMAISPSGNYVVGVSSADAFLWDGIAIRTLGIPFSTARGVNDCGVIVGEMTTIRDDQVRGFRWDGGNWIELRTLGDPTLSQAAGVNNLGTVVGWATASDGVHAVTWSQTGDIHDLAPGSSYSKAYGVSANGMIVGSGLSDGTEGARAVRFEDGSMVELGPGSWGVAYAASPGGAAVGSARFAGDEHATVFADGKTLDLGTVPGMPSSRLLAVNSVGIAVGVAFGSSDPWPYSTRGVIYIGGRLRDLNTMVADPGVFIVEATGIAEDGTIAAWGVRLSSGRPGSAFLLRLATEQ